MKIDFNFLKDILTGIENDDKPFFCSSEIAFYMFEPEANEEEEYLYFKQEDIDKLYYHFQLLFDQECIVRAITFREIGDTKPLYLSLNTTIHSGHDAGFDIGNLSIGFNDDRLRLTNKGHDLLVSLKDNKIMKEITRSGRKIALESVIGIASALGTNILTKIIES